MSHAYYILTDNRLKNVVRGILRLQCFVTVRRPSPPGTEPGGISIGNNLFNQAATVNPTHYVPKNKYRYYDKI